MSYNFGITPIYSFGDVSASYEGEAVTLETAAIDLSDKALTLSADALNTFNGLGDTDICAGALILTLSGIANASAKATVANYVSGSLSGDIGDIVSEDVFDGLFDVADLATAIASSISDNPNALLSLKENVLYVDPSRSAPNELSAGDDLLFNLFVTNGTIEIVLDDLTALDTSVNGVDFFTGPGGIVVAGVINDGAGENIYINGSDRTSDPSIVEGNSGYVNTTDGKGGILVRCKITLV
jgi:hypothetical protein